MEVWEKKKPTTILELVRERTEGLCIVLQKKNLDDSKIRPGLRVPDLAFKLPYVVYAS